MNDNPDIILIDKMQKLSEKLIGHVLLDRYEIQRPIDNYSNFNQTFNVKDKKYPERRLVAKFSNNLHSIYRETEVM